MDFEVFDRVRQAVKTLPVKCREPIVLKYLQELPTDEICGILGISSNALQVRLHRARLLLKQHLAELMVDYFKPFREKRNELEGNVDYVKKVLADGAERAKAVAAKTLAKARQAVGLRE